MEHLFNCHGEWTWLLTLLDSYPALRLWAMSYVSGQKMTETKSKEPDTIQ
jgi:hypothetical protein